MICAVPQLLSRRWSLVIATFHRGPVSRFRAILPQERQSLLSTFCLALKGKKVVSGTRIPETEEAINRMAPEVATHLRDILALLEHEYGDVQDVEFAIE